MAKVSADLFSGLGGAVESIFGGIGTKQAAGGYQIAAKSYVKAAGLYGEQADVYGQAGVRSELNANVAAQASQIGQMQTSREIYKALGGQKADIAAAGLTNSGSAYDVIHSSVSQGQLTMGLLREQGALEQGGYKEEALAYQAQQKASLAAQEASIGQAGQATSQAASLKTQGTGGILGGIFKAVATVAPFFF